MTKYRTEKFDIADDDALWGKFMSFARANIPYEAHWSELSEKQKRPLTVFIYDSEVMGEGHMGFLDMYSKYIDIDAVIGAMEHLHIPEPFICNIRKLPIKQLSVDELCEQAADEDEFSAKMDELDELFDAYDNAYYELRKDSTDIEDTILTYLRGNIDEFFEFAD
ncbi:MAG: hypothetical protein E7559_03710 [Ruminococcaceae bacterium]|nr:hypothetical protein [Oscillospiraceae bacterium]